MKKKNEAEVDLWNCPIGAFKAKRKDPKPKGHAGIPGSGPDSETCGSCRYLTYVECAKRYYKCGLSRRRWTGGRGSDVRKKDAACDRWEKPE